MGLFVSPYYWKHSYKEDSARSLNATEPLNDDF